MRFNGRTQGFIILPVSRVSVLLIPRPFPNRYNHSLSGVGGTLIADYLHCYDDAVSSFPSISNNAINNLNKSSRILENSHSFLVACALSKGRRRADMYTPQIEDHRPLDDLADPAVPLPVG